MDNDFRNTPFFIEVNRLRRTLILLPILWLPVGAVFVICYQIVFKSNLPNWCIWVLNLAYPISWFTLIYRMHEIICPKCGEKALRRIPFFTMKYVCCRRCDYPHADGRIEDDDEGIIGEQWKISNNSLD